MLGVVVSREDAASVHIGEHLLELADWTDDEDQRHTDAAGGGRYYRTEGAELRTFEELHLHLENAAEAFDDPDLLAFAARHAGETGPLLTAHSTGNFGSAELGGRDRELARAAPAALARVLEALRAHAPDGYDTGLECTHHGPSRVGCPSLFVEVGSDEPQWDDPAAARAVARSVLALRDVDPDSDPDPNSDPDPDPDRTLVGFGGGHYVPRFSRIVEETDWAVGHVASDWALADLDPERHRGVVEQAFERSGATRALLDAEHPHLEAVIEDLGYHIVSETWVHETTGVPLDVVARVEADLGAVDEGVRFGAPARELDGPVEFVTDTLPGELLAEANRIDHKSAREAVASHALAYSTVEGGSKAAGDAAFEAGADLEPLVSELTGHLEAKYDRVERRTDEIVAHAETFDPERARELGVEEGPAFGQLAAGESVDVRGRTVLPEEVRITRTERFEIPVIYRG